MSWCQDYKQVFLSQSISLGLSPSCRCLCCCHPVFAVYWHFEVAAHASILLSSRRRFYHFYLHGLATKSTMSYLFASYYMYYFTVCENRSKKSHLTKWREKRALWFTLLKGIVFKTHSKCRIWIFGILAFSTNFCPIKTDTCGNTIWPQASAFQKLAKMDHFWHF